MFKKILFPFISCFLLYQSISLVSYLTKTDAGRMSFYQVLMIAVLLNLFITGVFAFTGFAYPTSKILPDAYYRVRNGSSVISIYKLLGVEHFKNFLLLAFWGRQKNRKRYFDGTKNGLCNFDFQTRQSEFGHLISLIFLCIISIPLLSASHYLLTTLVLLINFIGNFYPIILQRKHRLQITRVTALQKLQEKRKSVRPMAV